MKLDEIVESVCIVLHEHYPFYTKLVVHPPINDSQNITATDNEGKVFSIEIKELKG